VTLCVREEERFVRAYVMLQVHSLVCSIQDSQRYSSFSCTVYCISVAASWMNQLIEMSHSEKTYMAVTLLSWIECCVSLFAGCLQASFVSPYILA